MKKTMKIIHKAVSDTLLLPHYDEYYGEGDTIITNPNPSLESLILMHEEHEEEEEHEQEIFLQENQPIPLVLAIEKQNITRKSMEEIIPHETEDEELLHEAEEDATPHITIEDKKLSLSTTGSKISLKSKISVKSKFSSLKSHAAKHKSRKSISRTRHHRRETKNKKSIASLLPITTPPSETAESMAQIENELSIPQELALGSEIEGEAEAEGGEYLGESLGGMEGIEEFNAGTVPGELTDDDLYMHLERRFSEKLEIFNEITACRRITSNDVSYVYSLRKSHSEPSLQQPLNPILQVREPLNPLKRSKSMESVVLSKTEYPSQMIAEKKSGSSRTHSSELKKTYTLSPKAAEDWKELKELKKKRYSFFNELYAKGLVVDSMEVPGKVDDVDYLVEADESALREEVDYARVVLKTKNIYTGNMKNRYFDGPGRYSWLDGTFYQGNFKHGVMHGEGVILCSDTSIYEGAFEKGQRVGWGIYATADGYLYAGDWKNGLPHGSGKIWYQPHAEIETDYYYGEFKKGKLHGMGVRQYSNGDRYIGEFKDSLRCGKGTMIWLDERQVYKGDWENGLPHGKGEHIWYLARTDNSCLVSRNVYKGDFDNGMRHGMGRYVYACGSVYEGQWYHGQRHNKGLYISPVGEPLFGFFRFGSILGGDEIPLHSPTYGCDFQTLVETLTLEFGLDRSIQAFDDMNISQMVIRYISEIRLLFKRAGYLGQCYGNQGVYPSWKQNESKDAKDQIGPFANMKQDFDPDELNPNSPDNVYPLTRFGFWLLLRDCAGITNGVTLAEFDRLWNTIATISFQTRHHPFEGVFLWQFLQCLVAVAVVITFEVPRRKEMLEEYRHPKEEKQEDPETKFPPGVVSEHDELRDSKKSNMIKSKSVIAKNKKKSKKSMKSVKSKSKVGKDNGEQDISLNSLRLEEPSDIETEAEEDEEEMQTGENDPNIAITEDPTTKDIYKEKFHISKSTTPIPPMQISTAFELVLNNYFIPCLDRDPGFNLPSPPSPLPPLGDLYNAFLSRYRNKTGLIAASDFVSSMIPPPATISQTQLYSDEAEEEAEEFRDDDTVISQATSFSSRAQRKSTHVSIAVPKTTTTVPDTPSVTAKIDQGRENSPEDDFLGGPISLGEVFAELFGTHQKRRSRALSHSSKPGYDPMSPPKGAEVFRSQGTNVRLSLKVVRHMSDLMLERSVNEQNQTDFESDPSSPITRENNEIPGELEYDWEEEEENETEFEYSDLYGDSSENNVILETIPLNDDELPQDPFLWERELTCKFDREFIKPLRNITEKDVIRVLRKLFPSIHGLPIETDMSFDMTFCDWLFAVSMLAKLSTDRVIFASITKQSEFDHVSKIPHSLKRYSLYYSPTELPLPTPQSESCLAHFPVLPPRQRVLKKDYRKFSSIEDFENGESELFEYQSPISPDNSLEEESLSNIRANPSQTGTDISVIRSDPNIIEDEEYDEEEEETVAAEAEKLMNAWNNDAIGETLQSQKTNRNNSLAPSNYSKK